jgi:hypothetical protein
VLQSQTYEPIWTSWSLFYRKPVSPPLIEQMLLIALILNFKQVLFKIFGFLWLNEWGHFPSVHKKSWFLNPIIYVNFRRKNWYFDFSEFFYFMVIMDFERKSFYFLDDLNWSHVKLWKSTLSPQYCIVSFILVKYDFVNALKFFRTKIDCLCGLSHVLFWWITRNKRLTLFYLQMNKLSFSWLCFLQTCVYVFGGSSKSWDW